MKKTVVAIALLLVTHLALASQCSQLYAAGVAPIITNTRMLVRTQELCSTEFVVMHSGVTRGPLWSAEHLIRAHMGNKIERVNSYHADERILEEYRSELHDFSRSGYDRGHLVPSASASNSHSQYETFALSNMIPENSNNNQQQHQKIEKVVRELAQNRGELYVITGPLFIGNKIKQLRGRVMVPTHIFKLVYDVKSNAAAAYLEKNESGNNYQVISIAELNKMAGINFLPGIHSFSLLDLPVPSTRFVNYKRDKYALF